MNNYTFIDPNIKEHWFESNRLYGEYITIIVLDKCVSLDLRDIKYFANYYGYKLIKKDE